MKRYDDAGFSSDLTPEAVQTQVERILGSEKFARSKRLRSLLRFTVQQTLQGHADTLKEYVIGTEVLKKPDSYDPRRDSLVRVLASRLRVKLKEYYNNGGSDDPLVIEFPKGKYVPRFQRREQLQSEIEKKLRARNASSQGRFLLTHLDEARLTEAAQHFEEAIDADPHWPAPHEGLAGVAAMQAFLGFRRPREAWPLARAQAETTLQLDEMSSEAHLTLGMVWAFYDWRWRDAESHFQKAIQRDEYSGAGHVWRALAYLLPLGRTEEALEELRKGQELVTAPFVEEAAAVALYFLGRYEEVLELEEHRSPLRSQTGMLSWVRACALAELGRAQEAIEALEHLYHELPARTRPAATLAYLYGLTGQPQRGREILATVEAQRADGKWIPHYPVAVAHAGLGDSNEALGSLQEAMREREPWLLFLALDPRFRSLRENPRYTGLVRRVMTTEAELNGAAEEKVADEDVVES